VMPVGGTRTCMNRDMQYVANGLVGAESNAIVECNGGLDVVWSS